MIFEVGMISGRLISCTLVAYGFARLEAPGKNIIFAILMLTLMIPNAITRIPTFILFTKFGWINSFKPLIVPAWFGEAYAIFLMRQFFRTIPKELEEAALVDGASRLSIIFRIIVPLSVPVLTVIAILSFKDIWNDFLGPLLYLNETKKYTVSIGLAYLNGQHTVKMQFVDGCVGNPHDAHPDFVLFCAARFCRGHFNDWTERLVSICNCPQTIITVF